MTTTVYDLNLTGTIRQILNGEAVHEDVVLWTLGRTYSCFPINLLGYVRLGDPKQLCPSEGFGTIGLTGGLKGIEIQRWGWEPMADKGRPVHSVNGCPNCPAATDAEPGLSFDERNKRRAERTGRCKEPLTRTTTVAMKVTWAQLGKFVKPALTDEAVSQMHDYMGRRYRVISDGGANSALEREGREMAAAVWDRAHAIAIGVRLGVLF